MPGDPDPHTHRPAIADALRQATHLLEQAAVAVPRLTAEVLLCHAAHCERSYLYAHPERELTELEWIHYGRYLSERLDGKPTQYITGRQEFYGREFLVSPDVLIPRPETELVVETALRLAPPGARMVDVGCGSGAIAVSLALERGTAVFATDISPAALRMAGANAARLGAAVRLVSTDLLECMAPASFQLVASNPPYVSTAERDSLQREVRDWEPPVALFAGPSGMEIYRRLVEEAARVLAPGGWLVMELGFKSRDRVLAMLGSVWTDVEAVPDLAGIPRVLAARRGA